MFTAEIILRRRDRAQLLRDLDAVSELLEQLQEGRLRNRRRTPSARDAVHAAERVIREGAA